MLLTDLTRKQAFLTHLAFSTSIFAVLSYLIVFHWYPDFYFFLDGGVRAIATIFFVDVVLGPGLTLLVFKPGKKSLKFDMSVILLTQLVALSWGIYKVYTERPATAVYYQGKITCISQPDAGEVNLEAIAAAPGGRQRLAFLQRPDTVDELLDFTKEAFSHQSSAVYYYGEKFVPLDETVETRLHKYEPDRELLQQQFPRMLERIDDFVKANGYDADHYKQVQLACRYGSALAVLDTRSMRLVDWLELANPVPLKALDEPLPLKTELYQKALENAAQQVFSKPQQ